MSLVEPLAVTVMVARAFESLGVRYLIGGSLASSFHGVPRSTNDADLVAELPVTMADALAAELTPAFYADAEMIRDAARRGGSFNVIHLDTMFKVDVFVATRDALVQEELARRQEHRLAPDEDVRAFFASAEDTVLQKLDWFRKGGEVSDRQWRDVLGVIQVQGSALDVEYLRRWAPHLRVVALLERALQEARSSPGT
ncbi:MAG: hypothetical protein A2138_01245 [Deltaproteobacteria bacterium RBG_16_71_12]|nr:MAG: hypothetical protein A2138_01245 [Deltaproteobacteria bacterium RBG_16_71_12]